MFKNVNLKKVAIALLLVIFLVIQISFLSYLFKAISPESSNNDKNVIMEYTSSGDLDYKVFLKPNQFINKEYIESGEAYILDLIDYIELSPFYSFKSTEKTNVTGTNKLVARLKVYYKESSDQSSNPEVLKKEVTLDEKVMSFSEKQYSMGNTKKLDLNYYLDILNDFQKQIKISMDGYLEVSYETDFNGTVGGASYKDKYDSTIKIPLSTSVIKIDKENTNDKSAKVHEGDLVKTNKTVRGYLILVNLLVFAVICVLLKKLFIFTNKNEYQRVIGKILKDYDDIIVNTSSLIDTESYKIIEISEFKEILNLSRELLLPIMNYELEKDKVTWFYVIKNDLLYRYIVKADELEEEKVKKEESSWKNKLHNKDSANSNINVDSVKEIKPKKRRKLKKNVFIILPLLNIYYITSGFLISKINGYKFSKTMINYALVVAAILLIVVFTIWSLKVIKKNKFKNFILYFIFIVAFTIASIFVSCNMNKVGHSLDKMANNYNIIVNKITL